MKKRSKPRIDKLGRSIPDRWSYDPDLGVRTPWFPMHTWFPCEGMFFDSYTPEEQAVVTAELKQFNGDFPLSMKFTARRRAEKEGK